MKGCDKIIQKQKYGNKAVIIDGIKFQSKKEANRYCELKLLERAGKIKDLELQKTFELIPTQREPDTITKTGKVKQGKVIERSCCYIADFVYKENGQLIVEDTKGMRTEVYKIKKKLMLYVYGIKIREI